MFPPGLHIKPIRRVLTGSTAIDTTITFSRIEKLISVVIVLEDPSHAADKLLVISHTADFPSGGHGLGFADLGATTEDNGGVYLNADVYLFPTDTLNIVFPNGNTLDYSLIITTLPCD